MPAFLEPIAFILRAGPEAEKYGDPYTASATVTVDKDGAAVVKGFTRRSDDKSNRMAMLQDVDDCMKRAGFTKWKWDRHRRGGVHQVKVEKA